MEQNKIPSILRSLKAKPLLFGVVYTGKRWWRGVLYGIKKFGTHILPHPKELFFYNSKKNLNNDMGAFLVIHTTAVMDHWLSCCENHRHHLINEVSVV